MDEEINNLTISSTGFVLIIKWSSWVILLVLWQQGKSGSCAECKKKITMHAYYQLKSYTSHTAAVLTIATGDNPETMATWQIHTP